MGVVIFYSIFTEKDDVTFLQSVTTQRVPEECDSLMGEASSPQFSSAKFEMVCCDTFYLYQKNCSCGLF